MNELDLQPTLISETITLRPVVTADFEGLYTAASDPRIWEQHPDRLRYKRDIFRDRFFTGALQSKSALVVSDNRTGQIIGSSRYYDWNPVQGQLAIGYTFLARSHWSNGTNSQMKSLMLAHAFQNASTIWFHVGKDNLRSRRAVEKLGAALSHEEERTLDGIHFVQLYYRLNAPLPAHKTQV